MNKRLKFIRNNFLFHWRRFTSGSTNIIKRCILTCCLILIGLINLFSQNNFIEFKLFPAFHDSSVITIAQTDTKTDLVFKLRGNKWQTENSNKMLFDSIKVILDQYDFWLGIDNNEPAQFIKSKDTTISIMTGLDGITINGKLSNDKVNKKFEIWSPQKGQITHDLMSNVIQLVENSFCTNDKIIRYLESIEMYFDFGLGLKKLSEDPIIYRLYGSLSSSDKEEIIEFFKKLPKDEKVTIDVSNLSGMGTMYYEIIGNIIKDFQYLYWNIDSNTPVLAHLKKIGVSDDKIIPNNQISKFKKQK